MYQLLFVTDFCEHVFTAHTHALYKPLKSTNPTSFTSSHNSVSNNNKLVLSIKKNWKEILYMQDQFKAQTRLNIWLTFSLLLLSSELACTLSMWLHIVSDTNLSCTSSSSTYCLQKSTTLCSVVEAISDCSLILLVFYTMEKECLMLFMGTTGSWMWHILYLWDY